MSALADSEHELPDGSDEFVPVRLSPDEFMSQVTAGVRAAAQRKVPAGEQGRFHHLVVAGRDVWLTEQEIRDSDGRRPGDQGPPTPAEQAEDLLRLEEVVAQRNLTAAGPRLDEPDAEAIGPWAAAYVREMNARAELYERELDVQLDADIARRRKQVAALRLRGLLHSRPPRLTRILRRLRVREPRGGRRRQHTRVGTALSSADPPREPSPRPVEPGPTGLDVVHEKAAA